MSIAVRRGAAPRRRPSQGDRFRAFRRQRRPQPRAAPRRLARRQVRPRGGPDPPDGPPGPRPPAARPAPRRPPPRPAHRHDDLRLPGLAARRPRPGARPQPRARRASTTCATCPASTRSSAPPRPGAASSPRSCPARSTTACWPCGTARRPASTARPTRCATATSSASRAPAARSPIVGDDPGCKSSTIPSASESLLASLHMPVFFPGNVQEVLDLGLHALACSRASGLWSGFKIVTSVADAVGTATVAPDRVMPVMPTVEWNGRPYEHVPNGNLLAPALARDGAHAARPAHRAGARLRARERGEPHRGRRSAPGSASSPPARPTTTCCTRCASSGSTGAASSAPASASSSWG